MITSPFYRRKHSRVGVGSYSGGGSIRSISGWHALDTLSAPEYFGCLHCRYCLNSRFGTTPAPSTRSILDFGTAHTSSTRGTLEVPVLQRCQQHDAHIQSAVLPYTSSNTNTPALSKTRFHPRDDLEKARLLVRNTRDCKAWLAERHAAFSSIELLLQCCAEGTARCFKTNSCAPDLENSPALKNRCDVGQQSPM